MSSGGKAGGQTQVTEYYVSLLLGVCWGPVTALRGVWIGEKLALGTNQTVPTIFNINRPSLHGDETKEGGAIGGIHFLNGDPYQFLPESLASKFYGVAPDAAPGYRDLCCVALTEAIPALGASDAGRYVLAGNTVLNYSEGTLLGNAALGAFTVALRPDLKGFQISKNNPYLKPVWVEVVRLSNEWYGTRAAIYRNDTDRTAYAAGTAVDAIRGKPDSNFVHILYETLTNVAWGMGVPWWTIDDAAFRAAADVCWAENLGGSFLWTQPMSAEAFAQLIADHIRAMIFPDPETGLITIRMIRKNYDENALPIYTPDNSELVDLDVRDANEVVNEVVVKWTNPDNYEQESVYAQDLASIADTGETLSETHDYSFFHRQDLADAAAYRDVLAKTAPARSANLNLGPDAPRHKPGDVLRLQFPEEGCPDGFFRVMSAQHGQPAGRRLSLVLLEDVLSEPFVVGQDRTGTTGQPTSFGPLPPFDVGVVSLPYYAIRQAGITYTTGEEYLGYLVASNQSSAYAANVHGQVPKNTGGTKYARLGQVGLSRRFTLNATLATAVSSANVAVTLLGFGPQPQEGDFVILGDDEPNGELCVIEAVSSTGLLTLRRGVLDTDPRRWVSGTGGWIIPNGSRITDYRDRAPAEVPVLDFRTVTFNGVLAAADQVTVSPTVAQRADRPFRPADVRINNVNFGGATNPLVLASLTFTVTWKDRNRLSEDQLILSWSDSAVTPEVGQTTTIQVVNASNAVIYSATGLTGGTHSVTLPGGTTGTFTVKTFSVRGGVQSLRSVDRLITV